MYDVVELSTTLKYYSIAAVGRVGLASETSSPSQAEISYANVHEAPVILPHILRQRAGMNWNAALEILRNDFDLKVEEFQDLFIVSYHYGKKWIGTAEHELVAAQSRGTVFCKPQPEDDIGTSYRCVCLPFVKFWSHIAGGAASIPEPWDDRVHVQEKLDGSIIKLFHHGGEWHVASHRTLKLHESRRECKGYSKKQFFDDALKASGVTMIELENRLDSDCCYMFEMFHPAYIIIVPVTTPRLVHIGTRNMRTLHEEDRDIGIEKPRRWDFASMEECTQAARYIPWHQGEGFVLIDTRVANEQQHSWRRIKVKSLSYLRLHRAVQDIRDAECAIDLPGYCLAIWLNPVDIEVLHYFPQFKLTYTAILNALEDEGGFIPRCQEKFQSIIRCAGANRSSFFQALQKHAQSSMQSVLKCLYTEVWCKVGSTARSLCKADIAKILRTQWHEGGHRFERVLKKFLSETLPKSVIKRRVPAVRGMDYAELDVPDILPQVSGVDGVTKLIQKARVLSDALPKGILVKCCQTSDANFTSLRPVDDSSVFWAAVQRIHDAIQAAFESDPGLALRLLEKDSAYSHFEECRGEDFVWESKLPELHASLRYDRQDATASNKDAVDRLLLSAEAFEVSIVPVRQNVQYAGWVTHDGHGDTPSALLCYCASNGNIWVTLHIDPQPALHRRLYPRDNKYFHFSVAKLVPRIGVSSRHSLGISAKAFPINDLFVIALSAKRSSGKDAFARELVPLLGDGAFAGALADTFKKAFAEAVGANYERLVNDRSYKESLRDAMNQFWADGYKTEKDLQGFLQAAAAYATNVPEGTLGRAVAVCTDLRLSADAAKLMQQCKRVFFVRIITSDMVREKFGWVFENAKDLHYSETELDGDLPGGRAWDYQIRNHGSGFEELRIHARQVLEMETRDEACREKRV